MSLIDIRCRSCATVSEVYRPAADWPATPGCPACGGPTDQIHLPPVVASPPPAIVVYVAPDGGYRVPGETTGPACAKYDRLGYRRIEAVGWAAVRQLEATLNQREQSTRARLSEARQRARESGESLRRSELRARLSSMSRAGRDFARAAMRQNDQKSHRQEQAGDGGGHFEAYSDDRGSRERHHDERGQRTRD
jgi:hypothetical protein